MIYSHYVDSCRLKKLLTIDLTSFFVHCLRLIIVHHLRAKCQLFSQPGSRIGIGVKIGKNRDQRSLLQEKWKAGRLLDQDFRDCWISCWLTGNNARRMNQRYECLNGIPRGEYAAKLPYYERALVKSDRTGIGTGLVQGSWKRRMGGTGLEPVTSCMSSKRSSHLS